MRLDEVLARINGLAPAARQELIDTALKATSSLQWIPNPGPQTEAYLSEADEIFFGGQAGGGKSALVCGLSITQHQQSLLLRRTSHETLGLVDELAKIVGSREGLNASTGVWRLGTHTIEIGGCQLEDDKQKHKGKPHDLIAFDELSDFSETQYLFICAWNR